MYIYVYIYTYSTYGRGDGLRDRGAVSERLMWSEWTAEWFMDAFRVTEGLSVALYPLCSSRQRLVGATAMLWVFHFCSSRRRSFGLRPTSAASLHDLRVNKVFTDPMLQ